jgi:hypothetical protein
MENMRRPWGTKLIHLVMLLIYTEQALIFVNKIEKFRKAKKMTTFPKNDLLPK